MTESENNPGTSSSTSVAISHNPENHPKFSLEVRRWKQGSYTLINDNDEEIKSKALDLMVFFGSKSWSIESGGNISYIARDEDNEVY